MRPPPPPPPTDPPPLRCAFAPGRVNLIGEHTDYTGGFVLPVAIGYGTACLGRGGLVPSDHPSAGRCRVASTRRSGEVAEFLLAASSAPESADDGASGGPGGWANYVAGVAAQYVPDLPDGFALTFDAAISGDVPLGSGLSSSASLEVSVARFLESALGEYAFSSSERVRSASSSSSSSSSTSSDGMERSKAVRVERALRCRRAENEWCGSPCGIMDQFVSSAAVPGAALLIDCRSLDYEEVTMGGGGGGGGGGDGGGEDDGTPVIVVCNSNVVHSIGSGEYPARVSQCRAATEALKRIDPEIVSLRDATMEDVDGAMDGMGGEGGVIYRRARHVVTENKRTLEAAEALRRGDWVRVGELMNASHVSMRDDYEVSCPEIDALVSIALAHTGAYGSRLTGGGFGGCTVTLVRRDDAEALMDRLRDGYSDAFPGGRCDCFVTVPSGGAEEMEV